MQQANLCEGTGAFCEVAGGGRRRGLGAADMMLQTSAAFILLSNFYPFSEIWTQ
jgi:hypothetical protein